MHIRVQCIVGIVLLLSLSGCGAALRTRGSEQPESLSAAQLIAIADALAQTGDNVRAQQYLQRALREGAPEQVVLPRLLRSYVADSQYRLAIEQAENYLRRHPGETSVRIFVASLYSALGAHVKAEDEFRKVLAQEPDDAQTHFALASTLRAAGRDAAQADQHYRAYLALEPDGPHAEEARANLLVEMP
jgi:tetratricopeptide (TPR) repeat protein